MSDIDFEELDKAVNSLVDKHDTGSSVPAPPPATPTPAPPPERADSGPAPAAQPLGTPGPKPEKVEASDSSAESHHVPVVTPQKRPQRLGARPAPPRSRGAYMDIVASGPAKIPSRQGGTIQPLSKSEDVKPEALQPKEEPKPAPEQDLPMVIEQPKTKEQPKPEAPDRPAAQANDTPSLPKIGEEQWPDPLDFHEFGESATKSQPETPEPATPVNQEQPAVHDEAGLPAGTSPFLAQTKVAKRPLGAYSDFSPKSEPESPATPEPEAPANEEPKPEPPHQPEKKEPVSQNDLHNTAMMSIPQQYHTQATPVDDAPRPIFDTKEYHPPLLEEAGHEHRGGGSMWSKLFIALVVLVLLAVGGYFAYLFLLQNR